MPAPISLDIRRRFARLIEEGLSARQAAGRLLISPASGVRLAQLVRQGRSLEFSTVGNRKGKGWLETYRDFFQEVLEQDADMTLAELRAALMEAYGRSASASGLHYALKRMGFTYKKRRWSLPNAPSQG